MEHIIFQSDYFCDDLPEDEEERYPEEMAFYDERCNLDVVLDTEILAVADMGLWNGRCMGYKELGKTLNSILYALNGSCDYLKFYSDGKDVKAIGIHHDGTNYVTFRRWKKNISQRGMDDTIEAIYMGKDNALDLVKKNTKSLLPDVKKIYGW